MARKRVTVTNVFEYRTEQFDKELSDAEYEQMSRETLLHNLDKLRFNVETIDDDE